VTNSQRWTLVAAIIGSGIVFLDGTIVNIALPRIGETIPSTIFGVLEGQAYIVSGYLAVLAALLILGGALADYYGRRKIFAIGLFGFGAVSVLCGIAPTMEFLVLFRLLQGAAGALLVPGSLSIITATFDGPDRARAFGIWAAATSALTPGGQILGGILVDTLSWRAAFLINVPLVAIALWATLRHMPETRDESASGSFDWLGAFVGVLAVGGLAFGAIRGQEQSWRDPLAFVVLGFGFLALIAFPILMRRPNALVSLDLFKSRAFAVINLSTFLIYGALYVQLVYSTLLLQGVLGYTALASSLAGLPISILLTVLSTRVGTLAGRIGPRIFLVVGPIVMALGQLWYVRISAASTAWAASPADPASLVPPASYFIDILPAILLFGVGISLVVAPLTSTLMSSVPTRNAGLGSAINNALSRVGQPLLGALIFIAVSATFFASLGSRVPGLDTSSSELRAQVAPLNPPKQGTAVAVAQASRDASVDAFHLAAIVTAGLLLGGAGVNYVGLRQGRGRRSETAAAGDAEPDHEREGRSPPEPSAVG
jgi:EmrB/QacA subfamily drug resistance transporter